MYDYILFLSPITLHFQFTSQCKTILKHRLFSYLIYIYLFVRIAWSNSFYLLAMISRLSITLRRKQYKDSFNANHRYNPNEINLLINLNKIKKDINACLATEHLNVKNSCKINWSKNTLVVKLPFSKVSYNECLKDRNL